MRTSKSLLVITLSLLMAMSSDAQWSVIYLHPDFALDSHVYGVSKAQQVGNVSANGTLYAALWRGTAGSWQDLTPVSSGYGIVYGVGDGQQVGKVGIPQHACLWTGSTASIVDLHPPIATYSEASGAGGGQQVGGVSISGNYRASLWTGTAASWINLNPAGVVSSYAYDVSGGKQVGYTSPGNGNQYAALWSGTAASCVSLHPAGGTSSVAFGVEGGQQVGQAYVNGFYRASLWTGTALSWVDLTPSGATHSSALAVHSGMQAGHADFGLWHAGVWSGSSASWQDLSVYLPAYYEDSQAKGIDRDVNGTYVVGDAYNLVADRYEAIMWVKPNVFMLYLNKASVAGQNSVLATILTEEVKSTNTVFTTFDDSSLVTTPQNVTVLAGKTSRNFQVTTVAITSTVSATIFAKLGNLTRSRSLTLAPLIPTAVSFTPSPVTGGQTTSCRVVINGVAGPGGRVISTFDNSPFATTPNSITVPAGATEVTFPIMTTPVLSVKYVTVTARVSAGEKSSILRISP